MCGSFLAGKNDGLCVVAPSEVGIPAASGRHQYLLSQSSRSSRVMKFEIATPLESTDHVGSPHKVVSEGLVDRTHLKLRQMAITLRLPPGERLNESILAKELGVSCTPLRDAQNRLMVEGFLDFSVNQGFFRKTLDVKEIFDLYELRQHIEMAAVRLAVKRATDEQLVELEGFARKSEEENQNRTLDETISLDEEFHERLTTLTGNMEMWNRLRNVNQRIHCVRWIGMDNDSSEFQTPHRKIIHTLRERNMEEGIRLMGDHTGYQRHQIIEKVEECYRRLNLTMRRNIQQNQT
jgi:DNA-binding GntR family transcriptional regulator